VSVSVPACSPALFGVPRTPSFWHWFADAVGVATASIDIGSEYIKVGLVKVSNHLLCLRLPPRDLKDDKAGGW
jgi:hypothetical protein